MTHDLPDCAAVAHGILTDAMRDQVARVTQSRPGGWLPDPQPADDYDAMKRRAAERVADLEREHERNRALIADAAAIAAGRSDKLPTREHLDALFSWFEVCPESECCSHCGCDRKEPGYEPATFYSEAQPTGVDYCTKCHRAWEPAYWPESEEIREEMSL